MTQETQNYMFLFFGIFGNVAFVCFLAFAILLMFARRVTPKIGDIYSLRYGEGENCDRVVKVVESKFDFVSFQTCIFIGDRVSVIGDSQNGTLHKIDFRARYTKQS